MTLLVVGRSGQLARHLKDVLPDATFWGREQIDWLQPESALARVIELAPSHIINATAYTAVDRAEEEPAVAWVVNCEGPRILACAANELGIPLVHISTDFVFDGRADAPYRESSLVNPINVYGLTKLAGELAVRAHSQKHWIIRTSWVFSEHGNNFVKTIIRLAREQARLTIVEDQSGRPTYAGDLANVVRAMVMAPAQAPFGLYHLSGGDVCSWYDFANEIVRQAVAARLIERAPEVAAITTPEYPTQARRPMYSVLAQSSLFEMPHFPTADWRVGLASTLAALGQT